MKNINNFILLPCFIFSIELAGMQKAQMESEIARLDDDFESQIREVCAMGGPHRWYSAHLSNDRVTLVAKNVASESFTIYFGYLEINRSSGDEKTFKLPREKIPEYFNTLEAKFKNDNK